MSGRTMRWLLSLLPRGDGAARGGARLTIVRHHRIYADDARPLYRLGVSESVFRAQLAMLGRAGLTPVTVAEGLAWLAGGRAGHRVAMSFDDGYADNVTRALPLLKEAGARATFFLTAGWMETRAVPWWDWLAALLEGATRPRLTWRAGDHAFDLPVASTAERGAALNVLLAAFRTAPAERERRLESLGGALGADAGATATGLATWAEAARLVSAGMEVGAHTLAHPPLDLLDPADQRREVEESAALIERRLGVRPAGLAYPGGAYDARTLALLEGGPIAWAVTTRAGDNRAGAPRFELRRRGLSEGACLGPSGRFSSRLARAELNGAFDRLRGVEVAS